MDVQPIQNLEPDAASLAAALARKNPAYAKEALSRARVAFVQIPDLTSQVHPSLILAVDNGVGIVPPLPHLAGFDGQATGETFNLQHTLPDNYSGSAVGTLNYGEAAQVEVDQGANEEEDEEMAAREAADQAELKEWKSVEEWYKQLQNPTPADEVRYAKAKRRLEIRNKRSESQKHLQEKEKEKEAEEEAEAVAQESEDEMFVRQNDEPEASASTEPSRGNNAEPVATPARPTRKRKAQNKITAEEKRKSMAVGFEPIRRKAKGKKTQHPGGRGTKRKAAPTKGKKDAEPSRKKEKKETPDDEPDVLLNLRANVIQEAHDSATLAAPETFTAGTRDQAVFQMIAAIPAADQEEARSDGQKLKEALRKFNHRVLSDKQGGWKMKGVKTSMFNYQVLGCAFMRDRENSPEEPRGGILGDVMVNIIDGAPSDPDDPVKTTLLVVPSHLCKHWMDQIRIHCDSEALGRVIQWRAGSRFESLDVKKELESYQIIITTYDEIRRSYPVFKPPKALSDPRQLEQHWKQIYEENCGPLHKIKFLRIVLDGEDSSVSLAVRGLTGRHKWILSGTPIHNHTEEFFPLLSFIGVPKLGEYEDFISYYCSDAAGEKRLTNLLRAFMMRRTHGSRLFSLPIIQLPDIKERSVEVEFSEAEWLIYEAIEHFFIDSINALGDVSRFKEQQCRQCLTMFLRLRMFCSHPLTVQQLLKELLRGTLLGQLKKLTREGGADPADASAQIVEFIEKTQHRYKDLIQQNQAQTQAQEQQSPEDNPMFYDNIDLIGEYSRFMKKLHVDQQWDEAFDRGGCAKCGSPPDKPVITSCMHLWCEECFTQISINTERVETQSQEPQSPEQAQLVCLKCTLPIESATRCCFDAAKEPERPEQPVTPAERKARRQAMTSEKAKAKKKAKPEDEDDIAVQDWMQVDTTRMPAAKIAGIKDILQEWKSENPAAKIVIFSQFTDMIQIIADMCTKEKWENRCLTGKVAIATRHKYLDEFKTKDEITILIVSLRAGGIGLDMTAAHKCILVDLWWNEAIQNQAFCRLLRQGQTQTVECVKMVVKGSIDEQMLKLQASKTEEIKGSMGDAVLKNRDSVIALLKLFADVQENQKGQLRVKSKKRDRKKLVPLKIMASERANHEANDES
ncbi:P-loop containing nucleoside triphosphate hydrolase protein [Aspergillus pseudodeflectus]|uniref:P-loop containing nucleoside triphosphate hydrolase protein n=1 Tax=Aspergillus pseudodeflectus TaxID=176178 RepID=A0ABR4KMQ1_9EURO